jgi:hypothetical protein
MLCGYRAGWVRYVAPLASRRTGQGQAHVRRVKHVNGSLRVGIVVIGLRAAIAHGPASRSTGSAEVVGISRRNPDRLAQAREELAVPEANLHWRDMLDLAELDAVVASAPNCLHAERTLGALARGLHVFKELLPLFLPDVGARVRSVSM